jgi:hypothetical protein
MQVDRVKGPNSSHHPYQPVYPTLSRRTSRNESKRRSCKFRDRSREETDNEKKMKSFL